MFIWARIKKNVGPAVLPASPLYSGLGKADGTAACRQSESCKGAALNKFIFNRSQHARYTEPRSFRMKTLLALLSIASALCAQTPSLSLPSAGVAVNGWQSVVNSMVARKAFQPKAMVAQLAPTMATSAPASPCSVPLLKMQFPSGVRFSMQTIQPSTDKIDRMQATVPAPPCADPPK
jgi:hypothetical protein